MKKKGKYKACKMAEMRWNVANFLNIFAEIG